MSYTVSYDTTVDRTKWRTDELPNAVDPKRFGRTERDPPFRERPDEAIVQV